MDAERLQRVLSAFADTPADLDMSRGTIMVQVRDELIEARAFTEHGDVHVEENGTTLPASRWIVQRIARLPILADRMLSLLPPEPNFVTPSGTLIDQLEYAASDGEVHTDDALKTSLDILGRRPAGTSSVLYLTSDAGEGKTTLISQLARFQAQRYKEKKTDWLLLPVALGGRTFMRFDDVVIGSLVNRLRFPLLYFDAFIELVRLGAIVPALDGFEEMFVEGAAGDAVSALGNLMQMLESSGSVLIAARKAYFEYKSLHTQARLFDSLGKVSVAFARLGLLRWDRKNFLEYSGKRGIDNGADIYDDIAEQLQPTHPLLTRAVLVRRLLDVAAEIPNRTLLLQRIGAKPSDYFAQFVSTIVEREAKDKWIDKIGEPAHPLISPTEHHELLGLIAHEMWISETETLKADVLGYVAEMYAESKRKDQITTGQIVERIKQHALIVHADNPSNAFRFDHQEFFHYFLGYALGRQLAQRSGPDVRQILKVSVLPENTVDTAVSLAIEMGSAPIPLIKETNAICQVEPSASYLRDNLGAIVLRLLVHAGGEPTYITNAAFGTGALSAKRIASVTFKHCYFHYSALDHSSIINCRFEECEFECLELADTMTIEHVTCVGCRCFSVVPVDGDVAIYAPLQVIAILKQSKFEWDDDRTSQAPILSEPEQSLLLAERFFRLFLMASEMNEDTIKRRLGTRWPSFCTDVLPALERTGIVAHAVFRGAGKQRRFRLGVPLRAINDAIERADGDFGRFLATASSAKGNE